MYAYPGSQVQPQPQGYGQAQQQPQSNYAVVPAPNQPQNEEGQQYSYYPSGDQMKFETVTPTAGMVQAAPAFHEYDGQALPPPTALEETVLNKRPLAPLLMYNAKGQTYSMPLQSVSIKSELHVATAFVSMKITFTNTSNSRVNGLFVLPTKGTVTSCEVNINHGSRYLDTTFIDSTEAGKFQSKKKVNEENPIDRFIPDVFRLPIAKIGAHETVTIEVEYMENLQFMQCRYHFVIPLQFSDNVIPNNVNIDDSLIHIECSINCLTPGLNYGSSSHQLILVEQQNLKSKLIAKSFNHNNANTRSPDFHISYAVQTNVISAALVNEPPSEYAYDPQGSFACFVNPPALQQQACIARDIFFLLDRSGSMTGVPYRDAVKGLEFALDTLTEYDRFGIIAFDHEQIYFQPAFNDHINNGRNTNDLSLYPATASMIAQAKEFLHRTPARGATDIRTPLLHACDILNKQIDYSYGNNSNNSRIPFVVLLTDGAVQDEKVIVNEMKELAKNVRILTFGIGQYCNWYFLKMLSLMSRGWNDGCIYPEDLLPKMTAMMDRASTPILTNVELIFDAKIENLEIYPQTIPDLFVGGPIVIAGKYSGFLPAQLQLRGRLGNGQSLEIPVTVEQSEVVPVSRVFLKQRVDQLTAQYWLTDNEDIKKQIVDISVNESFPSPYTSMIAYELTPKEKAKIDKEKNKDNEDDNNKKKKKSASKGKGRGLSAGKVAALAGGAVVIGAGAFLLFGNVGATLGNVGIPSFGAGLLSGLGGVDCPCDGCMGLLSCGNCDCGNIAEMLTCGGCGDCDQILDCLPCGDCDGGCIELPGCGFCESMGDSIGGCMGGVCGQCGGMFGDVGGCLGGACDNCGDVVAPLTDCVGGFGDCCGQIVGNFGDIIGSLGDCLGDIAGCAGELCGAVTGLLNEF